jgi:hypothetical protein
MSQLALPLAWPADPSDDAFLVGPSNERAVRELDRWRDWPVRTALLIGPRKSGRSLLARIFAAKSGGAIVDDADGQPETVLFHAWNRAEAEGRPTLFVANQVPPGWEVRLPDLRSRLAASPIAAIGAPDDDLACVLLDRLLTARGLDVRADLLDWLGARIERSHLAVMRAADALGDRAMERRARLSIPFARATLAEAGLLGPAPSPPAPSLPAVPDPTP